MPVVCPAILASDQIEYRQQMDNVAGLAHRLQIDLTDGRFAKSKTVKPDEIWWPVGVKADIHLMYHDPTAAVRRLWSHKPHMIIVHAESEGDFNQFAAACRHHKVQVGVALLADTSVDSIAGALDQIDHVLIFSGKLGEYGGRADLDLLTKVTRLKQLKADLEIGWDGGVNDQNVAQLVFGGVDVLNVGGYLQKSPNPAKTFSALARIAHETGTT